MDIGGRIRAARKALGMTQEELARRAGMSLKGMGDIERGAIPDPHFSSLHKIAAGLDVPVGELLEEPVLAGKAEAPTATGRADAEQREDFGGAYRPRNSVPRSRPAETVEEVFGGYPPPTVEMVLDEVYGRWEKHVDRFVERWTEKLKAGNFELGEVKECWANLKDDARELGELNRQEQDASQKRDTRSGRAIQQLSSLIRKLHEGVRDKYGEDELSKQRQKHAEVEALLEYPTRKTG